ncbi:hypothetical protein BGZ72_004328 [Mortierella alpina]|nr:hypothetical protein BGZ72_004328 [Mortierella alpina]
MSKRPRTDAEARSAKDKTRHFLSIFRDPPDAEELVHSLMDRTHDLAQDGKYSTANDHSDEEPDDHEAEPGEDEGAGPSKSKTPRKPPFRGLQFQPDGSNQRNILIAARVLACCVQDVSYDTNHKTVPVLDRHGKDFKAFAKALARKEPSMADVTGPVLFSLYHNLINESLALERYLSTASRVVWQETQLQRLADTLRALDDDLKARRAQIQLVKAQQRVQVDANQQGAVKAVKPPRPPPAVQPSHSPVLPIPQAMAQPTPESEPAFVPPSANSVSAPPSVVAAIIPSSHGAAKSESSLDGEDNLLTGTNHLQPEIRPPPARVEEGRVQEVDRLDRNITEAKMMLAHSNKKQDKLFDKLIDQVQNLTTMVQQLSGVVDHLSKTHALGLVERQNESTTITEKIDALAVKSNTTIEKIDTLSWRNNSTADKIDALSSKNNTTTAKIDTLTAKNDNTAAKIDTLTARNDNTAAKIDTLSARSNMAADKVDALNAKVRSLESVVKFQYLRGSTGAPRPPSVIEL